MALRAASNLRGGRSLVWIQDAIFPAAVVASVLVILIPLPVPVMSGLLVANIGLAILLLLATIHVRTPLELSLFPTLLLATTLTRLVLNVGTTRMILTRAGDHGLDAAGGVVRGFSEFVVGQGSLMVGVVIFLIILIIQFVVITKGAARIGEVAARFALDGLPGKQLAIDADLSAGTITEGEAQRRREALSEEADFFSAMDGAGKFVRGDAIAGLAITLVNVLGGLVIGISEAGLGLAEAAGLYTRLTIGDGLVSQVPALLISLAAGILVTRSSRPVNLPRLMVRQLLPVPQALVLAACFLFVLVFTGLPSVPLLIVSAGCVGLALLTMRRASEESPQAVAPTQTVPSETPVEEYLHVDPLLIEIGVGLIPLADRGRDGDLLAKIGSVRAQAAREFGVLMPQVRVRDNLELGAQEYRIHLFDVVVARGELLPNLELAQGADTVEDGLARALGKEMDVLTEHLTEVVRQHASELLTRDATKQLLARVEQTAPATVQDLVPDRLALSVVQNVLSRLLREQVSIRPLVTILEALGDAAYRTQHPVWLTEHVRERLAPQLCQRHCDTNHNLYAVTLDPALCQDLESAMADDQETVRFNLTAGIERDLLHAIEQSLQRIQQAGHAPLLVVPSTIRPAMAAWLQGHAEGVTVLGSNEITAATQLRAEILEYLETPLAA